MDKKSYYAIIPASVRYDKRLPLGARMLYGEITALANERGFCWATNRYFSELYEVTSRSISGWIGALVDCGHIELELEYEPGTKNVKSRKLYLTVSNFHTYGKNLPEGIEKNFTTPMEKIFQENTTSINNTLNTTKDGELYNKALASFLWGYEKQTGRKAFTAFGKEGKNLKAVIKLVRESKSDDAGAERLLESLIRLFWSKVNGRKLYWKQKPFTPSMLLARYDDLITEVSNQPEVSQEILDTIDRIWGGGDGKENIKTDGLN